MKKKGFTLIEIMIAIAVISVIMGVVSLILNTTVLNTEYLSDTEMLNRYSSEIFKELEEGFYYSDTQNIGLKKAVYIINGNNNEIEFLAFSETTIINPDTVNLGYKIKDSADGSNRKNLIVLYLDENNIERIVSENVYKIYSVDTSIIIFDTALPNIPYKICYLPETSILLDKQIKYYYDSAIKKILRRDNTGIIELPYTYKFTNNDLKIIPAEEGLFNFILNDKTDTNIVNSLNNDSAAIVKISYYVYNVKKENDKLKNTRMIYLIYKRN